MRQDHPLVGRRVRLVHCSDEFTRVQPGTLGTVNLVDGMGTVHVKWDDGSRLGMIDEAGDRYELLPEGA